MVVFGMLIGHLSLHPYLKIGIFHPHFVEQRHHIHACAAGQRQQQQRFGFGAAILPAKLRVGIYFNGMAVNFGAESHPAGVFQYYFSHGNSLFI